ncbi:MAG TPA: hypothetical protein VHN80_16470 [Kineosporiaceae bacterium]|nr:hypothetical protein [Kineosporiaceae bacterium]
MASSPAASAPGTADGVDEVTVDASVDAWPGSGTPDKGPARPPVTVPGDPFRPVAGTGIRAFAPDDPAVPHPRGTVSVRDCATVAEAMLPVCSREAGNNWAASAKTATAPNTTNTCKG